MTTFVPITLTTLAAGLFATALVTGLWLAGRRNRDPRDRAERPLLLRLVRGQRRGTPTTGGTR